MQLATRRLVQFSTRTLLLATAVVAISLVPVAWVARERQKMLEMQEGILRGREEAIRAVLLAERRRVASGAKGTEASAASAEVEPEGETLKVPNVTPEILIEHLRRENNELKDTVDSLRLEVKRLRAGSGR